MDDILLEMKDVKSELHVKKLVGVLVRKERCAETKAEIVAGQKRLEREQDEQDDQEREPNLQEALGDKTKVVKLVIDKWFVDRGFGFGTKSPQAKLLSSMPASCIVEKCSRSARTRGCKS